MENKILPLLVAKVVTMQCGLRMKAKWTSQRPTPSAGRPLRSRHGWFWMGPPFPYWEVDAEVIKESESPGKWECSSVEIRRKGGGVGDEIVDGPRLGF